MAELNNLTGQEPLAVIVEPPPAPAEEPPFLENLPPSSSALETSEPPSARDHMQQFHLMLKLMQENNRQTADLMSKALAALQNATQETETNNALLRALIGERDEKTGELIENLALLVEELRPSEAPALSPGA